MSRELRDALPAGANGLRAAVWEFMRPMLSPRTPSIFKHRVVEEIRVFLERASALRRGALTPPR